jgi:hypothetical protein
VVTVTARARDESENRDLFHFKAEAMGEVELRFSRGTGGDTKKDLEYVIRMKVRAPSEYHMKPHTG